MAFERYVVKKTIEDADISTNIIFDLNKQDPFWMSAFTYVINMNFVVVGEPIQRSIALYNYGYEKAKIKLQKEEQKRKSVKSCFSVQLERKIEIRQCESAFLNISFNPKKELFPKSQTDVYYTIFLKV